MLIAQVRTEYLSLMHLILLNSEYFEHAHRQQELQSCFSRIVQEDDRGVPSGGEGGSYASMDRDIVLQIFKHFPTHFTNPLTS